MNLPRNLAVRIAFLATLLRSSSHLISGFSSYIFWQKFFSGSRELEPGKMKLVIVLILLFCLVQQGSCYHFVLVHGAGQGAWCWYKVTTLLKQAGHQVDAVDLASAGINNEDVYYVQTLERYSEPLAQLLSSTQDYIGVVLVGNSLAGLSLTLMLQEFPDKIAAAVYVTALMFPTGSIASTIFQQIFSTFQDQLYVSDTIAEFKLEEVQELLYNESPAEDVELSKSLLKKFPVLDPVVNFTSDRYGLVSRYFIRTWRDNTLSLDEQNDLIQRTPPKQVLDLNASDHSPFFSQPGDLVKLLLDIAAAEIDYF